MKNKSMTKMPISMTFNRIFSYFQEFQAWNQQVQISKTFQIFIKARTNPGLCSEWQLETSHCSSAATIQCEPVDLTPK
jgi:hypothetical protein